MFDSIRQVGYYEAGHDRAHRCVVKTSSDGGSGFVVPF